MNRIGSYLVGTMGTGNSLGSAVTLWDANQANADENGQNLWQGAYARAGSADYRVGQTTPGAAHSYRLRLSV